MPNVLNKGIPIEFCTKPLLQWMSYQLWLNAHDSSRTNVLHMVNTGAWLHLHVSYISLHTVAAITYIFWKSAWFCFHDVIMCSCFVCCVSTVLLFCLLCQHCALVLSAVWALCSCFVCCVSTKFAQVKFIGSIFTFTTSDLSRKYVCMCTHPRKCMEAWHVTVVWVHKLNLR